ncbi:hypothetical protein LPJ81_002098 [Coemansia sp. IMI 209127]|nr:hypothetical protein LPJ81_002098 [Coemansia sp. IMI 209127]
MVDGTPEPARIPALAALCQRAIAANIQRIRHLGTAVPQFLIAEALAQCTPEQLEAIESWNPHIIDDNEPLWATHCTQKYKALKELHDNVVNGTARPVLSWRTLYYDMKRQDEVRAQEIMGRVREKTAALERERNSRKIQVTRVKLREPRHNRGLQRPGDTQSRQRAAGTSLLQRARQETKAHISMLGGSRNKRYTLPSRQETQPKVVEPSSLLPREHLVNPCNGPATHVAQMSPSGSPAQSPPYHAPTYSPPYLSSSSASSCSPTHSAYSPTHCSAYSPPYVPELASNAENSCSDTPSAFNIFEDVFGVSTAAAYTTLSSTVVIKEQPRKRRRARRESTTDMEQPAKK